MSKAPFLPLATDAFIGDTTSLNASETGAYIMLLICQWRNNGLPLENNPKKLQRMMRCTKAQFNKIWPEIEHFFKVTETTISQQRIEKDFKAVLQKIETKRQSGKLGGRPKSLKLIEPPKANGYDSLKLIESKAKATINQNHKPDKKKEKKECATAPAKDIKDLWNEVCPSLSKVKMISGNRAAKIRTRWKEDFKTIDDWREYFLMFESSSFLKGDSSNWQATFDWALEPSNMCKVLEGNYKNKTNGSGIDVVAYLKEKQESEEYENQ